MKVYVASSWRNDKQGAAVATLRDHGHEVYDFKSRGSGWGRAGDDTSETPAFGWSAIDPNWKQWTPEEYAAALEHPIAVAGFNRDMRALATSDACVMLMPCGPSASMELGYAVGAGKLTIVLVEGMREPDLMARMADLVTCEWNDVLLALGGWYGIAAKAAREAKVKR